MRSSVMRAIEEMRMYRHMWSMKKTHQTLQRVERLAGMWWHKRWLAGAPEFTFWTARGVHANFYGVVLVGSRIIDFGFARTSFHPLERTLVAARGRTTKSFGRRMEEHAAAVGRWRFFHSQHIFTSQEEEAHMGYIFNIYIEVEEDKDTNKPYKWLLWLW